MYSITNSYHSRSSLDRGDLESEKEELLIHSTRRNTHGRTLIYILACSLAVSLAANVGQLLRNNSLNSPRLYCESSNATTMHHVDC